MTLTKVVSSPSKRCFRSANSVPDLRFVQPSIGGSTPVSLHITPSSSPLPRRPNTVKANKIHREGKGNSSWLNQRRGAEEVEDSWPQFRSRVNTVPNDPTYEGCYRLRSFSITSRGILNLGDYYRYRSGSDISITSRGSSTSAETDTPTSQSSSSNNNYTKMRVLVLGHENVGKSSLIAQFKTSDYLTANDDLARDVTGDVQERTVSVLLDGEESELSFEEITNLDKRVNEHELTSTDAVILVYSVTDRRSFQHACSLLTQLKTKPYHVTSSTNLATKTVIMVGNKCDLVRCRAVSTHESRSYAEKYDSKHIETSVTINHNVDELLVGIVNQIRLKSRQSLNSKPSLITSKAKGIMYRFLEKCELKTRSCDNLHVL